jgi:AMP phosphorylase
MNLKAKLLDIQAAGKNIVILDNETASYLGVHSSDRVCVTYKDKKKIAIVNLSREFPHDHVGFFEEFSRVLNLKDGDNVQVQPAKRPEGLSYVRAKIRGHRLRENEIKEIVTDVVERHLSDIEIASFVTSLHIHGISMNEVKALTRAMVETGNTLDLNKKQILDKHSIGGIPGDKTSILVVPIIAAAGFVIPKTSSRAVTSPAGTADRVETLCPVDLAIEEIKNVVDKTNACLVWGGALDLAPADDIFIQIEYPLAIDPLLLPSIMSKKKATGATHLVIDIPTGRGAKIKTIGEANSLAHDFIDLGKLLGIKVQCAVTYGEQPLGRAIGPALEAREALSTIMGDGPEDLREKAKEISSILFEMVGVKNGKRKAEDLLRSGKAEKKLREIIEAQGGNSRVSPRDIEVGDKMAEVISEKEGRVLWISNRDLAQIAKEAGAPKESRAGIVLKTKLGDYAKKGEILLEIYAERNTKLDGALNLAKQLLPIGLSKKPEERMLMDRIPSITEHEETFMLER